MVTGATGECWATPVFTAYERTCGHPHDRNNSNLVLQHREVPSLI